MEIFAPGLLHSSSFLSNLTICPWISPSVHCTVILKSNATRNEKSSSPFQNSLFQLQATLPNPKGCPCHPPPWIITIIRFYEDIDLNRRKSVSRWSPTKKWNSRQTYLKCRPSENLELWALKLTFFGHFWLYLDPKITHARTLVWATPTLCLLWTRPREAEGLFWIWKQVSNTLSMISAQSS